MRDGGFGLYVHWPFCQSKCPYCDFNSHVRSGIDDDVWREALLAELARSAEETPDRDLVSIFFGGGTPSLMAPDTVGAVIDAAQGHWRFANDIEITLEANPTSIEAGKFRDFRHAGVNRVSVGVQALNDRDLARLGRLHSAEEAIRACAIAREAFDRTSFDLIYARQDQTLEGWRQELGRALELAADHLSLYQLTIEPGTAFGARFARGGLRGLPDEDLAADMYALTQEMTEAAGLPAYEISNHARPDAWSRHNMIYWTGGDWVGIGPGAHGRLTIGGARIATVAHASPERWLSAVSDGSGEAARETVAPAEDAVERLMMGLRLTDGVAFSETLKTVVSGIKLSELKGLGFVEADGERLKATASGRPVLNAVLRELLV